MAEDLRITNVQCVVLDGNFSWPLIRIDTDAGIVGYGEAFTDPWPKRITRAILDRRERLVGTDGGGGVP